jgi:hypothetical protein
VSYASPREPIDAMSSEVLSAARHPRTRLLAAARPALPLRGRGGGRAADRSGRRRDAMAAGTAALISSGAGAPQALAVAISAGALGVRPRLLDSADHDGRTHPPVNNSKQSCVGSSATTCSSSTRSATSRSNVKPPTCSSPWCRAATSAAQSSSPATRGFEQWGEILADAMVAAALIDRLVHYATMITLKGKSYRLRRTRPRRHTRRSGPIRGALFAARNRRTIRRPLTVTSHRMMAMAPMTPLYIRRAQHKAGRRSPLPIGDPQRRDGAFMEPSGRNGGNRWQMERPRKPLKQADPQPVATHGNRFGAHGKEGVNGSSPLEGFTAGARLWHSAERWSKRGV